MLDAIVTVSEATSRHSADRALASVHRAASLASFRVNVIRAPGVPGHIGRAYRGGFESGHATYVVWVDDDDWLLPNAFSAVHSALQSEPDAVFAREIQCGARGQMLCADRRHHPAFYRRSALEGFDWNEWAAFPNVAMQRHVQGAVVDVPAWVYVYNMRADSGGMSLRNKHQQERQACATF